MGLSIKKIFESGKPLIRRELLNLGVVPWFDICEGVDKYEEALKDKEKSSDRSSHQQ